MDKLVEFKDNIIKNISKVMLGKEKEIELLIVAFLSEGHVLLEDPLVTEKDMIIKAFSKTLHLQFNEMNFTPDLRPVGITGLNFYNSLTGDYQFKEGPLFSNIVSINDINRGIPSVQSVLLEAMEEKQITIEGLTRNLQLPFMVLASQSKEESEGKFYLSEAKLDRFLMRINLGGSEKKEKMIEDDDALNKVRSVIHYKELSKLMQAIKNINIDEKAMQYLLEIVDESSETKDIKFGNSPRRSIDLYKAARAFAAINGRKSVVPEDIEFMAPYILNHRIIGEDLEGVDKATISIKDMVSKIRVPIYSD